MAKFLIWIISGVISLAIMLFVGWKTNAPLENAPHLQFAVFIILFLMIVTAFGLMFGVEDILPSWAIPQ